MPQHNHKNITSNRTCIIQKKQLMQNSAKHLIAALIGFAVITASIPIVRIYSAETAAALSTIYTLALSGILAAICIIISVKHQKFRRYYLSLSMVMFCFFFAELYIGIHTAIKEVSDIFIITLPITEIAYLGATAFIAAFCARIWYEEIPENKIKPGKTLPISIAAALVFLVIGRLGISAGFPLFIGIPYAVFDAVAVWHSVKFFAAPKIAKPFLPLMTLITVFLTIDMLWTFIIPLLPGISEGSISNIILASMTFLQILFIPALIYAEEQREKRAQEKQNQKPLTEAA